MDRQLRRPFLTHLLMELAFVLDWSPRAHQSRTRLPPPLAIPPIAMGLSLKRNAAGPPGACAKTGSGATSRLTRLYWCHAPLWSRMKVPLSFWITSRDSAETPTTPAKTMRAANGVFIWLNIIISPKGSGISALPVATLYFSSKEKNRSELG